MIKYKFIIIGLAGLLALSSCGIFGKGCGCPHFSKMNKELPLNKNTMVQMC